MFHRELGLTLRSWVVWYYTFGVNCKTKFSRSPRPPVLLRRGPQAFHLQRQAIRVPSARQLVYADARANPEGPPARRYLDPPPARPARRLRRRRGHWYFPRVCGTFKERAGWHGCQMPEQLLAGSSAPAAAGRVGPGPVRRQRHDAGRGQEARPAIPRLRALARVCRGDPETPGRHPPRPTAGRQPRAHRGG